MSEYLTPEDLKIVTGYTRPNKQAQWLKDHGIPHRLDHVRVIAAHKHVRDWLEGKPAIITGGLNMSLVK